MFLNVIKYYKCTQILQISLNKTMVINVQSLVINVNEMLILISKHQGNSFNIN